MTDVSVVIPARDAAATIGRTLEALAAQDLEGNYEVIVVDDGSEDETVDLVRAAPGPVRLLQAPGCGAAAARNAGAAAAAGEVLAFTDADCFPAPDWLRQGVAAIEGADLVQGRVTPDPAAPSHPLQRTLWVVEESGLYETANIFVRRRVFERLGGFEDGIAAAPAGRPFAEDAWFGWRLRRAGGSTRFCEAAIVHHEIFESTLRAQMEEGLRLYHFPLLVARVPELRRSLLFARVFLSRRTALFDLAVAGLLAAVLRRSPRAAAVAIPYLWLSGRGKAGWRRHAPRALAAEWGRDAAGLAALLAGGVRARTPVL